MVEKRICKVCGVNASYGVVGGSREYCSTHADKNTMINLTKILCSDGCGKIATHGSKKEKS
jgi:hypothetical protein